MLKDFVEELFEVVVVVAGFILVVTLLAALGMISARWILMPLFKWLFS